MKAMYTFWKLAGIYGPSYRRGIIRFRLSDAIDAGCTVEDADGWQAVRSPDETEVVPVLCGELIPLDPDTWDRCDNSLAKGATALEDQVKCDRHGGMTVADVIARSGMTGADAP